MDELSYLSTFVARITGLNPNVFLEVRYRRPTDEGMKQKFFHGKDTFSITKTIRRLAKEHDVYVGAAPRTAEDGRARAIKYVPMLWVDCDSPEATSKLGDFPAPPTFVIASGTPGHVHAWWYLDRPVLGRVAEIGNRRLTYHLKGAGGDLRVCDRARILRPPATLNHKTDPPLPVVVIEYRARAQYGFADLVGNLPDPPPEVFKPKSKPRPRKHPDDPVLDVPATDYIPALTGEELGFGYKVNCPFHESESGRSLHCYPEAEDGWHCFGCGKGGDVYTFASLLWGLDLYNGDSFRKIKRRLRSKLREYL